MEREKIWKLAQSYQGILATGAALRLALCFAAPSLGLILERRPELSTPLTSFRSLKEGVIIHHKGTNPYSGGVFYHSPLYLALFTYIIPASTYLFTALAWTIADMSSSAALVRIWRTRNTNSTHESDWLVAGLYLFNPYTILSCLARSTTSIDNAILLHAISFAASGQTIHATFFLAFATHTSLYPILLLPPFAMLLMRTYAQRVFITISTYMMWMAAFTGIGYGVAGKAWLGQTFGVIINVTDLTPNVGMWWYFFTEMFDHFRMFFLGVFQLHNLIYVAPICVRLSEDPLFAILVLVGVFGTWKSYPSLGDMALWAGLLGCFPEIVSNLRHPLFTLTVHLYTSILLPLLHSLWLLTGTGNANFFYAATMVYGLNASLAVVDVMGAGLRLQVKRKATKVLLRDELEGQSMNEDMIADLWERKGWSVVQFTGQLS
ncbi:uncharacterized protein IL334_003462 [Kwoniella shivajii]|uniref:Phosphatidylinositol glycan, class U n=1 Tax=Kwoniella shivajii TaxID=564305 RepID=A0ABZ1CXM1_9TREE|nr:hypothetical protein IL334_003462 [Kwoniella shivajii]